MVKLQVLYVDNHLLVVHKPAGVLVQPDQTGDRTLLDMGREYVKQAFNKPGNVFLGLVHRLDRPVSGVVVFARTSKAAARLFDQFAQHTVRKVYWALVQGEVPPVGQLHHTVVRVGVNSRIAQAGEAGQTAELAYQRKAYRHGVSWVEIELKTGRHHQIRVQFAASGHPLVGDWRYGTQANLKLTDGELALHAYSLTLQHPTRPETLVFTDPPTGFWERWL
jgi:23S rRNA pseudouridine1911/1915/1917 synthase